MSIFRSVTGQFCSAALSFMVLTRFAHAAGDRSLSQPFASIMEKLVESRIIRQKLRQRGSGTAARIVDGEIPGA